MLLLTHRSDTLHLYGIWESKAVFIAKIIQNLKSGKLVNGHTIANRRTAVGVVLSFAVLGTALTLLSLASTSGTVAIEAENAQLTNASVINDSTASGNKYVQLGSDPEPPQATGEIYGNPWYGTYLDNHEIGKYNNMASYRFRAKHTAQISNILYYLIWSDSPGYHAGNCGDLEISIQTDDGSSLHKPSGTKLGTHKIMEPCDGDDFPRHGFSPTVSVQAGQLYHIVFDNTDPQRLNNWVSIDYLYFEDVPSEIQRGSPDGSFAVLMGNRDGTWELDDEGVPIVEITYNNGQSQGMGYMEFDWYEGDEYPVLNGSQKVRQRFTVSRPNFKISTINVRVGNNNDRNYAGSSVNVKLINGSQTLASGTVQTYANPQDLWSTYTLPSPLTLQQNQTYYLELTSASGQSSFTPMQKGSNYGFTGNTYFKDGYMEVNMGSGWKDFLDDGRKNGSRNHDISFYFDIVE